MAKAGAELTNDKRLLGTRLGFAIRPDVMSVLKRRLNSSKSGLVSEVLRGRTDGVFLTAAWMLYLVSPKLSGNYYVFARAGDFPRKSKGEVYSRKALRDRINWAKGAAIHSLHLIPKFQFEDSSRTGGKNTMPANATQDPELSKWDIPIIAEDTMLVPTNWTGLAQIRRQEMYRLNSNFAAIQVPGLLILGRILREVLRGNKEVEKHLETPSEIWGRLKEVLEKQHEETRRKYRDQVQTIDKSMVTTLRAEEAKAAFLAFSIIDFRLRNVLRNRHALASRDLHKRQEMRKFT